MLQETLQSILFRHQLKLKHYSDAIEIIESIQSWERKSNSLHIFVSTLIADGKLEELISFSYTGLEDHLDSFLSTRARSLPFVQAVNFYNILYSFHINLENVKKGTVHELKRSKRNLWSVEF